MVYARLGFKPRNIDLEADPWSLQQQITGVQPPFHIWLVKNTLLITLDNLDKGGRTLAIQLLNINLNFPITFLHLLPTFALHVIVLELRVFLLGEVFYTEFLYFGRHNNTNAVRKAVNELNMDVYSHKHAQSNQHSGCFHHVFHVLALPALTYNLPLLDALLPAS